MTASGQASTLGIVAGRGNLPAEIARAAASNGRNVLILALKGQADNDVVSAFPHEWVRLGDGSKVLKILRGNGIRDLVFAGGVTRPSLWAIRPDARAATFLAKAGFRALGDDSLLSAILREFESEGFRVVGADDIWREALMPAGTLTRTRPDDGHWRDIARGAAVANALGAADVGQGVVVQQGIVLAVEAIEGTDAMLARAGSLRRDGPGGVLVKLAKPGQDMRVDLPTVGLETVKGAIGAGLCGIAVEAGAALLLDRQLMLAAADDAGLFVTGIGPSGLPAAASAETGDSGPAATNAG